MSEPKPEIWKCARRSCGWEGEPKLMDFGKVGTAHVCAKCGTEDVFPRDDGLWPKADEDNEVPGGRRSPSHDPLWDDN